MPALPLHAPLEQLRCEAQDLLRAAGRGAGSATRAGSPDDPGRRDLGDALGTVARRYGFGSWAELELEVERRAVLDARDLARLEDLLSRHGPMAVQELAPWHDHPLGASPLGYVAMLRYDTSSGSWRDVDGTADLARALLAAGAPVDGSPGDSETPLITAASYGDAAVAQVLVEAGADIGAKASATAGGVPGGTPIVHAAVFGMTAVVDVLVRAGARPDDPVIAAAAGDLADVVVEDLPLDTRVLALVMAADHERIDGIDRLVAAGTPVDAADERWGRQPLRLAAENGRPRSVRRLLELGADPGLSDPRGRTPLDICRAGRSQHVDTAAHDAVEEILLAVTPGP